MTITITASKVSAVLLAGGGWHNVNVCSFKIEDIALKPDPGGGEEAEDYGFAFVDATGKVLLAGGGWHNVNVGSFMPLEPRATQTSVSVFKTGNTR